MNELQQSGEQYLGRILTKPQATRLKQVQLQLEGPGVVLRQDMIENLNISDEQIEQLEGLRSERRQMQGEIRRKQREFMQTAMQKANPAAFANNAPDDGNGGNGRIRRRFDPELMKKVMDTPEVKAQMELNKTENERLENQYAAAIQKILYPRQRAALQKLLGPPFDRSQIFTGWRGLGTNRGGPNAGGSSKSATSKADSDDDEESPAAAPAPKPKAAAPAKPSTPRRKSLRELRGTPSDE
jgi:Spy/CpxP family protein refolding chaperone